MLLQVNFFFKILFNLGHTFAAHHEKNWLASYQLGFLNLTGVRSTSPDLEIRRAVYGKQFFLGFWASGPLFVLKKEGAWALP